MKSSNQIGLMHRIRVGVAGLGRMVVLHLRNVEFSEHRKCILQFQGVDRPRLDAVAIALPPFSRAYFATFAVRCGQCVP